MEPVYLFSIASQRNQWLAVRQSTIAGNVANANTPGFKALDVAPFESVMERTRLALATTQPGHLNAGPNVAEAGAPEADQPWEVLHSGNTVSIDKELLKAGEVNRQYALNTNIMKSFHRMLLASAKG
jgi:flagellar basal-body rod protein FlgB